MNSQAGQVGKQSTTTFPLDLFIFGLLLESATHIRVGLPVLIYLIKKIPHGLVWR